eukprot:1849579-Pleurochrysis_carterae.AAC.1
MARKTQRREAHPSRARTPFRPYAATLLSVGAAPPLRALPLKPQTPHYLRPLSFLHPPQYAQSAAPVVPLPTPSVPATPQTPLPPPPEQSPTWLLERPANAARRRRLNRTGCQRVLGLPCACVACTTPILHAVTPHQPAPTAAPAAAPNYKPSAQPGVGYASQPSQPQDLLAAISPTTSPPL